MRRGLVASSHLRLTDLQLCPSQIQTFFKVCYDSQQGKTIYQDHYRHNHHLDTFSV